MKMCTWLDNFAQSFDKRSTKSMKKTAQKFIVDKSNFPNANDDDIVEYEDEEYKVIDSNFKDEKGTGILLQKCAGIEDANPIEVAMGCSPVYTQHKNKGQEYAYVDPKIQDETPRDAEVAKFNEEADDTAKKIDAENAIDGTSGATRPNRIIKRMVEDYTKSKDNADDNTEDKRFEIVDDQIVDVNDEDDVIDLETYDFDDNEDDVDCEDVKQLADEFKVCSNRIFNKLRK